jgi:hypothetical protein
MTKFKVQIKITETHKKDILATYMLKSENLSITFSFGLSWIPASAGMTR